MSLRIVFILSFSDEFYISMQPGHFQGNSYDIVSAFQVCLLLFICSATRILTYLYLFYNVHHAASVYLLFLFFMQCYGEYVSGSISDEQRKNVLRNSCPGAGACGGMYTANTMASAIETMGMSLPYRCK